MSEGGPCACRCYRDTKMEIQGLSGAPNILSQHGASRGTAPADPKAISSPEKDPADSQEPPDTPIGHHNRSRTAAFRLLVENGSESACSPVSKPQTTLQGCPHNSDAPADLCNVNKDTEFSVLFGPNGCVRTAWKYDVGSGDNAMQMTVPLFEGEEELEPQQLALPSAGLRQQREDGPAEQPPEPATRAHRGPQEQPPEPASRPHRGPQEQPPEPASRPHRGPQEQPPEPATRPHRGPQEQPPEPATRPHRGPQEQPPEPATRPHRGPQEQPPEPASRPHRGPQEQPPEPASRPHRGPQEQPSEPASRPHRGPQELYVVLNFLQDGKEDPSGEDGNKVRGKTAELYKSDLTVSREAENVSNAAFGQSDEKLNCLDAQNLKTTGFNSLHDTSVMVNSEQESNSHITEKVVLTNKYGDKICGRISTENNEVSSPWPEAAGSSLLMPRTAEMENNMDTSELITDPSGPQSSVSPVSESISPPASETFSGTITINNQSIIVSIENGVLTLAAPSEGCVHKEDDMVSLKEHLGMKDHEDIVLLNYDSGTKSIGKISTLALTSSNQQEEPRLGLSVSDSEFALVDDCALSELGTSLDSCPIVKQEAGLLCTVTEADLISPSSRVIVADCDNDDAQSTPLSRSKKDMMATLGCPEPGCSCLFDTRQKLKVHLLNHAEEPRPYQCSVEGCGWAFATSYKLKRHLRSHDKQRPHSCQFEGCGRRFTTVYNLKAHIKVHEQDSAFICEICSESFRSATRLSSHQRVHFEPQRPHKCEFPGCEKTFITFSALFSHNRTHFREVGHFTCSFPGCDKTYDKACRLKIHMRSHTGERPFVCDSEDCGWSFTSMSKLLRHKRKHDDDRRFVCTEEGCGKSFTRAEHLKGHSITHLGTKPFQCHAEGCNARFSARSSLYIHSKKHKQDASTLRTRCPVANCSKHFSSRSSLKSHMVKHHHVNADVLSQMETTPTLTPSSELISSPPTTGPSPGVVGSDQLANLDLSSLFSVVPGSTVPTAGIGVGIPVAGGCSNSIFTMDLSLVSSGILTIDPSSVGSTLSGGTKALDPLILTACSDMCPHHGLEGTAGNVLPPQGTLNLDDVQTVTPEALGTLTALTMQGAGSSVDSCLQHHLSVESAATLAVAPVPELLASPSKVEDLGSQSRSGPLLGSVEVLGAQEGGKVLTQFVFPSRSSSSSSSSFSPQKGPELNMAGSSGFLESGGSARTDYRAIQLAKKRKQRGPAVSPGALSQRKGKGVKAAAATSTLLTPSGARYTDGAAPANGGLSLRDPVCGGQYVHIQLLQDDPAADGDLAFQLSSQPSSSHSQLTVDLPVNILQETSVMTEDDNNSDNSQFTGSTINLQDLE